MKLTRIKPGVSMRLSAKSLRSLTTKDGGQMRIKML